MRGLPEPVPSITRGLQAEKPFIPAGIMRETNVLELEIGLSLLPLDGPGQMCFVELLPKSGDLDRIAGREENIEDHGIADHHAVSLRTTIRIRPRPDSTSQISDRLKSPRPRRAAQRLRGLTEGADEGAAH